MCWVRTEAFPRNRKKAQRGGETKLTLARKGKKRKGAKEGWTVQMVKLGHLVAEWQREILNRETSVTQFEKNGKRGEGGARPGGGGRSRVEPGPTTKWGRQARAHALSTTGKGGKKGGETVMASTTKTFPLKGNRPHAHSSKKKRSHLQNHNQIFHTKATLEQIRTTQHRDLPTLVENLGGNTMQHGKNLQFERTNRSEEAATTEKKKNAGVNPSDGGNETTKGKHKKNFLFQPPKRGCWAKNPLAPQ